MAVAVFFGWLGVCALVSWLTAFQMPDGFGNAIFGMQLLGAAISAPLMAMGLPTAIDPSTKVVVTPRGGGPNYYTTWPRRKGVTFAAIGFAAFLVTNIGGWVLDNAMGLPERHAFDAQLKTRRWADASTPAIDACLATVWTPAPVSCEVRFRVTTPRGVARADLAKATCGNAAVEACLARAFAGGSELAVEPRQLDSLKYAGSAEVGWSITGLIGKGPPPPVERAQ